MPRFFLVFAAVSGGLVVALGAAGAHALRSLPDSERAIYDTALRYQMFHTVALLALGIYAHKLGRVWTLITASLWTAGIFLFSGSLIVSAFLLADENPQMWLRKFTPTGGMAFIIGWVVLAVGFLRHYRSEK